jgi:hypothetical protein
MEAQNHSMYKIVCRNISLIDIKNSWVKCKAIVSYIFILSLTARRGTDKKIKKTLKVASYFVLK